MHVTKPDCVLSIIRTGIKIGLNLPPELIEYAQSKLEYAYFSAVNGLSFKDIELTDAIIYGRGGEYQFLLNRDWVKVHTSQFRERAGGRSSPNFWDFVREYGIREEPAAMDEDDVYGNQIVSLDNIPVEGIEALLVRTHNPSSGFVVDLKNALPKNMQLYIGNEEQTIKIK